MTKILKERLDKILLLRGLVKTRNEAQGLIMSGNVFKDEHFSNRLDKPGISIPIDTPIFIKEKLPFVSRGGLKLKAAIDNFNIDIKDKICLDIGASTGGFTDCLLQKGALKVYALDVGENLLHENLKNDTRVILREKINFRFAEREIIDDKIDLITVDVSFISLKHIFPNVFKFLIRGGILIALIKPQFEAGKGATEKGILKDDALRDAVVKDISEFAISLGFQIIGILKSPITGGDGNIEYLLYALKP